MECYPTFSKVSTRQARKCVGKPNAKARRNSRRLQEYNQKKAISAIRNSLAARMQSSIESLVESHRMAFQTRQQYYRNIIYRLHKRIENKDTMIAKLGVSCHYLYERVQNREYKEDFLRHLAAKYDWLRHNSMEEVRAKINIYSESYAAERRAYPRRKRQKQRIVPIHKDEVPVLPGEVEFRVNLLRFRHGTLVGEKAGVSARGPASKVNRALGGSSGTQNKTVPIPPAPGKTVKDFAVLLAAKKASMLARK